MFAQLYRKYERYLSVGAFLLGFIIDNLTLTRIDLWLDNVILGSYLLLAGFGIFLFHFLKRKPPKWKIRRHIVLLLPLLIQFAFGGLFSGYFVFYSRSASFATTWVFVLFIVLMLVGNEFFKKKYVRLEFQISMFFVTLFSFAIFYIPILFNQIGALMFLLSGAVSLLVIWMFIKILSLPIPKRMEKSKRSITRSIIVLYLLFNVLYFTNIIPPIPLSLKEASVHHFVERDGDEYSALTEGVKWYEIHKKLKTTIHITEGRPVYVFTSVFAPTDLKTAVFHRWQYYDEELGSWTETDRLSYAILGGRDGGYRGYSAKSRIREGRWRVDIITDREQVIGRVRFEVVNESPDEALENIRF